MTIRVMFDACTPRPLRKLFPAEFVVSTAQELGWAELGNGSLQAAAAENSYDLFVTIDADFGDEERFPSHPLPTFLLRGAFKATSEELAPTIPIVCDIASQDFANTLYVVDAYTEETRVFQSLIESENWRTEIDKEE